MFGMFPDLFDIEEAGDFPMNEDNRRVSSGLAKDAYNPGKKSKSQPDGKTRSQNIFNIPDENMEQFKDYMAGQAKELAEALKDKYMKTDEKKAEEEKAKELLEKAKKDANKKSTSTGDGGVDPTAHTIIEFLKKRDQQAMKKQELKQLDDNQHFINAREERIFRQRILNAKLQEGDMANAARLAVANRRKTAAVMQNRRLDHIQSKGEPIILPMNTISHNMAVGTS